MNKGKRVFILDTGQVYEFIDDHHLVRVTVEVEIDPSVLCIFSSMLERKKVEDDNKNTGMPLP